MAFETQNKPAAAEQMKTVKAVWDKAPSGSKKDAAQKHYAAAETALKAHDDKKCISELNQASQALK